MKIMSPVAAALCAFALSCAFATSVAACTIWSAAGSSVAGGGTLIAKNRDWRPDHVQEFKLFTPSEGLRYYGLYAKGPTCKGVMAGINEKGLVMVSAMASALPKVERLQPPTTKAMHRKVLSKCVSVAEAIELLRSMRGPKFLMLADRQCVAQIEIGKEGLKDIKVTENGAYYHTNHYLAPQMLDLNIRPGASSKARYQRIKELVGRATSPFTLADFIKISRDRHAGKDNSIERLGSSSKKSRTVASFIVKLPPKGEIEVYFRDRSPGKEVTEQRLTLAEMFN